jgi:hypothetical protein
MVYNSKSHRMIYSVFDYTKVCSFADIPQKESDALQEKISALVAEQSARIGSSTFHRLISICCGANTVRSWRRNLSPH